MEGKSLKRSRDSFNGDTFSIPPAKYQRKAGEDDVKLAKLYKDLATESDDVRLDAAKELLGMFSPENKPSAEAVEKALTRLIRGLCNQHRATRFGFCVTLTEFLRQLFGQNSAPIEGLNLDVNGVVEMVEVKTKPRPSASKPERRDHLVGKLFGYKAIMQSSILIEPEVLLECWNKVLDYIYGMARDIPWLREECGLILYEAVKSLDSKPAFATCAQEMVKRLSSFQLVNTPEGVAIWLAVRANFPSSVLPEHIWHKKDPLSKKDRIRLAKILKEDFQTTSENGSILSVKSASANPNPIFVWNIVLSEVLQRDQKQGSDQAGSKTGHFAQFWMDAVDSNLFSPSSSHERKAWGFKLFARLIKECRTEVIPALFTPNFVRSFINQSKKEDRFLHAAALASLKAIRYRVEEEPSSAAPIMIAMTSNLGRLTKNKSLDEIMLLADDEALGQIIQHLHTLILRPGSQDQNTADHTRQTIADMLLHLVRSYKSYQGNSTAVNRDDSWLHKLLAILVENTYFIPSPAAKTKQIPLPTISESSRKMFHDRLSACLEKLLQIGNETEISFPLLIVIMIRSRAANSKMLELLFKADKPVLKTIDKAFNNLDTIAAKGSKSKDPMAEGFVLLYSFSLLQVYDGDGDAVSMLEELNASHKSLLKNKNQPIERDRDAFVEIVLTFLGNPRSLFRRIAEQAFSAFASSVTSEGLRSMTNILDTQENLAGQQELFEQSGDELEDEESNDDMEDVSDVEMIDGGSEASEAELDDPSTDSVSDSDSNDGSDEGGRDDDGEEDDDELAKFDTLLAQTLQTSKLVMNSDASENSSDEEEMDDEQMLALDAQLAKIFQEKGRSTTIQQKGKTKSKKKQHADAKQTVVHFKLRILDLLSIYVEKEYSNPLSLQVIIPMLQRIRPEASKQVADKSYKLLSKFFDSRTRKPALPKPVGDQVEQVWELLREIHEEIRMGEGSQLHATACSNASLHAVKVLVALEKSNYSKVVDVYSESQKQWFMDAKSAVQPTFFSQFQNCRKKCPVCTLTLLDDPTGLDVCLYCFNGGCTSERNHSLLHVSSTNHPLVLNIKRTRKKVKRDEPPQKISKLAIAAETEADRYDTTTQVKCYECGIDEVDKSAGKLSQVVEAVLRANTFARQKEVKAWEQELTACEHTLCLEEDAARQIESQNLGHCSTCDLKENLWLCLTCGNLGCGRAQFGGIGGNSHGLAHTTATGHPVAVKLGSLTADGTADIYCYACDEERIDPELPNHLLHWGINIKDRIKTEKSLTEMQVEQNLLWEFSMTTEEGKELKPLFGPGFTGLKNLGNSCYLASVLQSLFSMPEFSGRYFLPGQAPPSTPTPAEDLETQLRKVADGLLSGRYSKPDSDVIVSEHTPENPHQKGLAPAMLKYLIGKGHSEFSTMRQQDAFELLLHLLKLISRSQHVASLKDPVDAFRFVMEQRLQCISCKKVRYRTDEQENISIPVPIRRIPIDAKMEVTDSEGREKNREEFEPVTLKECLDIFTGDELVELTCGSCGSKAGFTKKSMFKTFPAVLAVNARRFELVNWVPTKQDVQVIVDDEPFAFDAYKSNGLQDGEEPLPDDIDTDGAPKWIPNEAALSMLEAMGFPRVRCEKALHATGNSDPDAASNWLFAHMEDPDIDTPVDFNTGSGSGGSALAAIDPEKFDSLCSMGFNTPQARQALKETGGDMERAVDWLFSHPDAPGDFDESNGSEEASNAHAELKAKTLPGSDKLPANFQLQSIVCHKGSSIHAGHYVAFVRKQLPDEQSTSWVLFNDEKVAKAADVDDMKKFAYVYFFRRL
ncbi:hypothetical protein K469DRAFT_681743 [Zopfia rhizophila CBS 207.26]|uniref:Ubiquitin carboxyl-terminal hydrolase 14 n=1 Tax=Zopfia rhizophila CBS 207.26 TaxID=1314779 RepID=A0A6A6EXB6_9PEZI|nr:hypothetical protein K469DRAFT_681743 [Zopfia rhizophila CBS 207.26]